MRAGALLSGVVDTDAFDVDVPIGAVPHTSFGGSVAGAVPGGGRRVRDGGGGEGPGARESV
eukprot:4438866-Pleurochrysis_carterae.AAC.1